MYLEFGLTTDDAIRITVFGSGMAELALGPTTAGVSAQLDDEMMRELVDKASTALGEMDRRCAAEEAAAAEKVPGERRSYLP
jgi:hypothetical protein